MNISEFQKCSNCGACYNICPKSAITVREDELFYRPVVNSTLCVDCSLCTNICPVNQTYKSNTPVYAYGGWHKNSDIVNKSSSGGVFYGLAQSVISLGGVVFAAAYSDDYKTVQLVSSDEIPLEKMLKSKYVESLVGYSFQRVKSALTDGRRVLFCGTPCQVAGLCRYLGKCYEYLITCDFACGGLPSHKIFSDYLENIKKKYQSDIKSVDFRPKTHGWKRYAVRIKFQNGKEYLRLGTEDTYLKCFLYGKLTVRDYCMECKFPENHLSDISIADFWLHDKLSSIYNEDGISLILCNTQKGKKAIELISSDYCLYELDVDSVSYNNHMQISEYKSKKRSAFLEKYMQSSLEEAQQAFLKSSVKEKIKNWTVRNFFRK